jgi:hypothetical protein
VKDLREPRVAARSLRRNNRALGSHPFSDWLITNNRSFY